MGRMGISRCKICDTPVKPPMEMLLGWKNQLKHKAYRAQPRTIIPYT